MEMSGLKSCEALASTCGLRRSLDGCLKFQRSGRSRRVQSQAEKKLKKGESKLREVGCYISWYLNWRNTYIKLEYLCRDRHKNIRRYLGEHMVVEWNIKRKDLYSKGCRRMLTQILASPCGVQDPWPWELVHAQYDWPETWNVCGAWWGSGCAAVDSTCVEYIRV